MKPNRTFASNSLAIANLLCALLIISMPWTIFPGQSSWIRVSAPDWSMFRSVQLDMQAQSQGRQGQSGRQSPPQVATLFEPFAVSADGELAAFAFGGNLTLMDLESGQAKWITSHRGVSALAFSRDGTEMVIVGNTFGSHSPIGRPRDFFVEVTTLDVSTGTVRRTWTDSRVNEVKEIAYTDGGSLVAVGAHQVDPYVREDGRQRYDGLFLWNISADRRTPVFPEIKSNEVATYAAAFAQIGHVAAISIYSLHSFSSDEELRLYDTNTGTLVHVMERGPTSIRTMAFSRDARFLATSQGATGIRLYDVAALKAIRTMGMLPFTVGSLLVMDDGRVVVMTSPRNDPMAEVPPLLDDSKTGSARMFTLDLKKKTAEQRIDLGHDTAVNRLVPGKNLIASVNGATLSLYDMQTGKLKASSQPANRIPSTRSSTAPQLPRPSPSAHAISAHSIVALSLFPNGRNIVAGSDDGALYVWNIASGNQVSSKRFSSLPRHIALSADGYTVATDSGEDDSLIVSQTTSNERVSHYTGMEEHASSIALSPRGDWLAAGNAAGTIRVWHVGNPEPYVLLKGHTGAVKTIAFSPDATLLASGGEDLAVRVWDLKSGKQIQVLTGHTKRINDVAFGVDRNVLASSGDDATIILWDVRSKAARRLKGDSGAIRSICFSPDQSMLLSGGDNSLRLWDVRKGKLIRVLTEKPYLGTARGAPVRRDPGKNYYDQSIMIVGFSPDGKLVACGSTDNSLLILDTSTWETRRFKPMLTPDQK